MHLIQFNSHFCIFFKSNLAGDQTFPKTTKAGWYEQNWSLNQKNNSRNGAIWDDILHTQRVDFLFLVWSVDRECFCWHVDMSQNLKFSRTEPSYCDASHFLFVIPVFLVFRSPAGHLYVTCEWWPLKFENNFRWQEWWVGCQRSSGPWFSFFWLCDSALTETKIIWEFDLSPRTQDAGGDSGSHKGLFIGISKAKTVLSSWRGIQQGIDPTFGNSPISRHKLRRQGQKLAPRIVYTVLKAYEVS